MDLKEHLSILNHFLIIFVERVKNGSFLKPTVLRFEPRLMSCFSPAEEEQSRGILGGNFQTRIHSSNKAAGLKETG